MLHKKSPAVVYVCTRIFALAPAVCLCQRLDAGRSWTSRCRPALHVRCWTRTLCAFRRPASDSILYAPDAMAHATGDRPARRARHEEGRCSGRGRRVRIGGCLQPRIHEVRRHGAGRMATARGGLTQETSGEAVSFTIVRFMGIEMDRPMSGRGRMGEFAGKGSRRSSGGRCGKAPATSAYVSSSSLTGHSCRQRPCAAMTGMRRRP